MTSLRRIASSGLHSNGYSLVRKVVFERLNLNLNDTIEVLGRTLGEELLEPTRIYVKPVLTLLSAFNIAGIAHITGGGLIDNIPRMLPPECQAVIHTGSWDIPPIFTLLEEKGEISKQEMLKRFNNGIGMVLAIPQEEVIDVTSRLQQLKLASFTIGEIVKRKDGKKDIIVV